MPKREADGSASTSRSKRRSRQDGVAAGVAAVSKADMDDMKTNHRRAMAFLDKVQRQGPGHGVAFQINVFPWDGVDRGKSVMLTRDEMQIFIERYMFAGVLACTAFDLTQLGGHSCITFDIDDIADKLPDGKQTTMEMLEPTWESMRTLALNCARYLVEATLKHCIDPPRFVRAIASAASGPDGMILKPGKPGLRVYLLCAAVSHPGGRVMRIPFEIIQKICREVNDRLIHNDEKGRPRSLATVDAGPTHNNAFRPPGACKGNGEYGTRERVYGRQGDNGYAQNTWVLVYDREYGHWTRCQPFRPGMDVAEVLPTDMRAFQVGNVDVVFGDPQVPAATSIRSVELASHVMLGVVPDRRFDPLPEMGLFAFGPRQSVGGELKFEAPESESLAHVTTTLPSKRSTMTVIRGLSETELRVLRRVATAAVNMQNPEIAAAENHAKKPPKSQEEITQERIREERAKQHAGSSPKEPPKGYAGEEVFMEAADGAPQEGPEQTMKSIRFVPQDVCLFVRPNRFPMIAVILRGDHRCPNRVGGKHTNANRIFCFDRWGANMRCNSSNRFAGGKRRDGLCDDWHGCPYTWNNLGVSSHDAGVLSSLLCRLVHPMLLFINQSDGVLESGDAEGLRALLARDARVLSGQRGREEPVQKFRTASKMTQHSHSQTRAWAIAAKKVVEGPGLSPLLRIRSAPTEGSMALMVTAPAATDPADSFLQLPAPPNAVQVRMIEHSGKASSGEAIKKALLSAAEALLQCPKDMPLADRIPAAQRKIDEVIEKCPDAEKTIAAAFKKQCNAEGCVIPASIAENKLLLLAKRLEALSRKS